MKQTKLTLATAVAGGLALAVPALTTGCGETQAKVTGYAPKEMADALFAVMSADRAVYTRQVVNRLQNEEKIIKASEHWKDEKALPLPVRMITRILGSSAHSRKTLTKSRRSSRDSAFIACGRFSVTMA